MWTAGHDELQQTKTIPTPWETPVITLGGYYHQMKEIAREDAEGGRWRRVDGGPLASWSWIPVLVSVKAGAYWSLFWYMSAGMHKTGNFPQGREDCCHQGVLIGLSKDETGRWRRLGFVLCYFFVSFDFRVLTLENDLCCSSGPHSGQVYVAALLCDVLPHILILSHPLLLAQEVGVT